MCALTAAGRGRKVMLIDHANKAGKKILMSGGGRCNFTNMYTEPNNFLSQNPHFCKSALARYTQWDFIAMVAKHGVPYHEKKLGQLFCDNKSSDILEMLLDECQHAGSACTWTRRRADRENRQRLHREYHARCVAVPVAGDCHRWLVDSDPGATGFGYQVAKQFGHTCCRPAQAWCRSPSPTSSKRSAPNCPAPRWIAW
jgi:predicted flavoprotein YhiN